MNNPRHRGDAALRAYGNRARLTVDQFAHGPLDKTKIKGGSQRMMAGLRLFVAEIPDKRLRQRVEVAISSLYDGPTPLSVLPDTKMHLEPRPPDEAPIMVTNVCSSRIYGLPETMSV